MVIERIHAAAAADVESLRAGRVGGGGGGADGGAVGGGVGAGAGGGRATSAPASAASGVGDGPPASVCICRAAKNRSVAWHQHAVCRCQRVSVVPPAIAARAAAGASAAVGGARAAAAEDAPFVDEVEDYICDRRVVGAHSALLALRSVPETELKPPTESLQVHLPGDQLLYVIGNGGDAQQRALDAVARRPTQVCCARDALRAVARHAPVCLC